MKYSINVEPVVDGTPVGRNCPITPTAEQIEALWKALRCTAKKLGALAEMVEVLQAHFRQDIGFGDAFLVAEFRAVLVVPTLCPARKIEAKHSVQMDALLKERGKSVDEFVTWIRAEVGRSLSMVRESEQEMVAMLGPRA
jgi:hypothetical protein